MTAIRSVLPGLNVLIEGPSGTGKTHAISTLVDSGMEVFYLAMEPGLETLVGCYTDGAKPRPIPDNLHWHFLAPATAGFEEMAATAEKINTYSYEMLTKMQDNNRGKYNQFTGVLRALCNFPDDRTGKTYGSVDSWGTGRALVVDGMTGLCLASLMAVVGGKPVKSMPDWGIAQDQVERLLRKLCDGCRCHFILIAHVEREIDPVLGGVKLMTSALGKALAPKIPAMFSDVILAEREGDKFTWNTASALADLKTRNLAIKAGQPPSFAPIIAKWQSRGGVFEPGVAPT